MPIDIVWEALVGDATFVARSFAGDPKQVKELIKAAISHNGIAVLDIISPCVTFNNQDDAVHSYAWGREHEMALHEICRTFPLRKRSWLITRPPAIWKSACMMVQPLCSKNLNRDFEPFEPHRSHPSFRRGEFVQLPVDRVDLRGPEQTGTDPNYTTWWMNRLIASKDADLRPAPETIDTVNGMMF